MAMMPKAVLSFAAASALFMAAQQARADHEVELALLIVGTPLAQGTLIPGYVSTVYYGLNDEKQMPVPWTVMNAITGAMGASFGALQFGIGIDERTGSSDRKQLRPFNLAAGAASMVGGAAVITASILQTARPNRRQQPQAGILVLPWMPPTPSGAGAGILAAGCF